MDEKTIQPHDDAVINQFINLMIRGHFEKEKGGMVKIKTELMVPNGEKCDASVMGYLLISGLTVWAQRVNAETDGAAAAEQAQKILAAIPELHKIFMLVNTDIEVKNLISQLNGNNTDNQTGVDQQK